LVGVAVDLVEPRRIRTILGARPSDALAFGVTLLGTWILSLHEAIYLGIGISLVMFLRRARMLVVHEMGVDASGHLRELGDGTDLALERCPSFRVVQVEGQLFFGAAGELQDALDEVVEDPEVRAVIVRIKRTQGLDLTTAEVFATLGHRLHGEGRHLILVGMRPQTLAILERAHVVEEIGADHVYPTQPGWLAAMESAIEDGNQLVGPHACGEACAMRRVVAPAQARSA